MVLPAGKTTLAQALADRYGLAVVSSDRVRKEMLGLDPQVHRPAAYEAGIYRPEVTERTYRALADRAERLVGMGESVVVDATFAGESQRALFRTVADRTHTATTWVRCRPPDDVVAERLRRRADRPDQLTDADATVAARLERHPAAWAGVLEVDTSRPMRQGVDEVARAAGLAD
ncbi:MAG: AAA family ATPase [Lapillicoccus sp.]